MVLLVLLTSNIDELVYETKLPEPTNTVTEQVTILYNLRIELLALITCCKQLLQTLDDSNNIQSLNDTLDTATVYISTEQAKRRVVVHTYQIQQYIDDIIKQLKSLPIDTIPTDTSLHTYLNDTLNKQVLLDALNEHVQQTSNVDDPKAIKLFDDNTSTLWFANKPLLRHDNTTSTIPLSKYLGSNEKSIVKLKLTNTATSQPTRTADMDADTRQAMMTYYQKQKQIQDQLQHQSTDNHSAAFNPNALKNAIHGFSTISFKT